MQTMKVGPRYWVVEEEAIILAEFILDPWFQMDEVIYRTKDEQQRRRIRELVFTHAARYQKNRNMSLLGGMITRSVTNRDLTEADSDEQMSFDGIPKEVVECKDHQMDHCFNSFPIHFTDGDFLNYVVVLDKVVDQIKSQYGIELKYALSSDTIRVTSVYVTFEVNNDYQFRVWKHVNKPSDGVNLDSNWRHHITPIYHPDFDGAKSVGLINGDTDSFIGRHEHGVDSVYSPLDARKNPERSFLSTWGQLNHPFYAEGKTLEMRISMIRTLSTSGYDLLLSVLSGALNVGKQYLEVSGGFRPPYPYPQRPRGYSEVRGCEHMVMWEYVTLEKEGKLEGSLIPSWFMSERWLDEFTGAASQR
jgi:hypothetical protein